MSTSLSNLFKPGTDRISKEITRHPTVINIITKALLDTENEYLPESTEWENRARSDMVLVPKPVDWGISLIVIEFQQTVDKKFMRQAIGHCLQSYKKIDIEPQLF